MNVNPQAIAAMRAITISREYGSAGGEIAARLARRLGWQLIDHAVIEQTARELEVNETEGEKHDEDYVESTRPGILGGYELVVGRDRQREKKGVSSSVRRGGFEPRRKIEKQREVPQMETNERAKRELYQAAEKELRKLIEEGEGIEKGDSKELEEKIYQGIFKIGRRLMEAVLNKGKEAVQTKREGKCGHDQKLVGYRPKKMLTLFGEVEWKRPYYQCQAEKSEEGGEKEHAEQCSHGSCPEDEIWGVEGKRTTPGVQRQVSYLCAMLTFEDAAETFRRMLPLAMSARQALNLMKPVGKA